MDKDSIIGLLTIGSFFFISAFVIVLTPILLYVEYPILRSAGFIVLSATLFVASFIIACLRKEHSYRHNKAKTQEVTEQRKANLKVMALPVLVVIVYSLVMWQLIVLIYLLGIIVFANGMAWLFKENSVGYYEEGKYHNH